MSKTFFIMMQNLISLAGALVTLATICGLASCNMTPEFLYLQTMRDRLQTSMANGNYKDTEMASVPAVSTVTGN